MLPERIETFNKIKLSNPFHSLGDHRPTTNYRMGRQCRDVPEELLDKVEEIVGVAQRVFAEQLTQKTLVPRTDAALLAFVSRLGGMAGRL